MTVVQHAETEVTITLTHEQFNTLIDALISAGMHGNNMAHYWHQRKESTQADAWREKTRATDALRDALIAVAEHEPTASE